MTNILTPTQREVARLYAAKWQPLAIAEHLGIAVRTVYQHAHAARRRGAGIPSAHGWSGRRPPLVDYLVYARDARAGMNCVAISQKHGVDRSTVARALRILREAGAMVPPPQTGRRRTAAPEQRV